MSDHHHLHRPDGRPLPEDYGLEYRKDRKTYRLKVSLDLHPRFSGIRTVIPLHTGDVVTARHIRDAILARLQETGILSRKIVAPENPGG